MAEDRMAGAGDRIDIGSREVAAADTLLPWITRKYCSSEDEPVSARRRWDGRFRRCCAPRRSLTRSSTGDFMGQVHPAPEGDPHRAEITESNLTAVWANFAQRGYRRLIYTNTMSVLPEATGMFQRAMGAGAGITRVLLTASDATAREGDGRAARRRHRAGGGHRHRLDRAALHSRLHGPVMY
ncbi:hypothetical protein GCM10022384_22290 [Streptomyces marokkonensis]|uniref:Uncharacterized protein n=1 Tax=Streptomyces marokkonensis TaxID=324855 RepID=A0ABP7PUN4_9ACTN